MVVWLKPCESRSSPGALPQIPVLTRTGIFYWAQKSKTSVPLCAHHAPVLRVRVHLYPLARRTVRLRLPQTVVVLHVVYLRVTRRRQCRTHLRFAQLRRHPFRVNTTATCADRTGRPEASAAPCSESDTGDLCLQGPDANSALRRISVSIVSCFLIVAGRFQRCSRFCVAYASSSNGMDKYALRVHPPLGLRSSIAVVCARSIWSSRSTLALETDPSDPATAPPVR